MTETTLYIDPGAEKFIENSKEVERSYIEACEWIQSLGIDYKKTRFGIYEKDMEAFVAGKDQVEGDEDSKERIREFLNANMEAVELIRIKTAFEESDTGQLLENIKKMTGGQKFRNSSKADQSRDFAFELGVATRFIRAGYEVDLKSISDLVVTIDGRNLYVECKRLKSYSQFEKRAKEANKQIRRRIEQDRSSKSRGLIALNVTDVVNANAGVIVTDHVDKYRENSAAIMKDFVLEEKPKLSSKHHRKCLGVLTEFTTQGVVVSDDIAFVNIREGNILEYPLKQNEKEFLDSFWPKLGGQNIYS